MIGEALEIVHEQLDQLAGGAIVLFLVGPHGARVEQHGNAYGTHFEMTRGHGDVHVPPLAYVPERSDPDWSPPVRTFVW